jgi:hypothetical protein
MVHALSGGTRKLRKPQRCFECYHFIPAGTQAAYQTNIYDGAAYTLYWHQDCGAMGSEYRKNSDWSYDEDGYPPLFDEINDCGDFQADMDAWRGDFPHVVTRMEFWAQKQEKP